jgi:V8-like Glu-specific endopeptidase
LCFSLAYTYYLFKKIEHQGGMMKKLAMMALISLQAFGMNKSICGMNDDRIPSDVKPIGRLLDSRTGSGGCTLTMISDSCAVSAGHCKSVLKVAEFNTPMSRGGNIQHPEAEDVYDIDQSTIVYANNGPGDDWAVFKVKRNNITGQFPGAVQGYYPVKYTAPSIGTELRITGYGLDRSEPTKNLAQQTNTGKLMTLGTGSVWQGRAESRLTHGVDTMGGNSGSTIVIEGTNEIIGIHTHGGCGRTGGANQGTAISKHDRVKQAIRNCLASE